MTKKQMLSEMFLGTQFHGNIPYFVHLPKNKIEHSYKYFVSHPEDAYRLKFCNTLLSSKN